jgi:hypothetical protein
MVNGCRRVEWAGWRKKGRVKRKGEGEEERGRGEKERESRRVESG